MRKPAIGASAEQRHEDEPRAGAAAAGPRGRRPRRAAGERRGGDRQHQDHHGSAAGQLGHAEARVAREQPQQLALRRRAR